MKNKVADKAENEKKRSMKRNVKIELRAPRGKIESVESKNKINCK